MGSGWHFLPLPFLAGAYVFVSVVTYADYPRSGATVVLADGEEMRGLALWRAHNCQVCHQIHGFGGFLGPDLTNRVTEETPDHEFRELLTFGKGRMPAFRMDEADQAALLAYLRALNGTGRSQPAGVRSRKEIPMRTHLTVLADAFSGESGRAAPPGVARGLAVWERQGCGLCHVPFAPGNKRAPDLFAEAARLSPADFRGVVLDGRGEMPAHQLAEGDLADLAACLDWIRESRSALTLVNDRILDREPFSWGEVPWFEYR